MLRLILAGVFDRFSSATVVIGHMGELLPFNLARLDDRFDFYEGSPAIAHPPSWYVRNNVMITTSGVNDEPALQCAISALGADRIMFAVDYPYQRNPPCRSSRAPRSATPTGTSSATPTRRSCWA